MYAPNLTNACVLLSLVSAADFSERLEAYQTSSGSKRIHQWSKGPLEHRATSQQSLVPNETGISICCPILRPPHVVPENSSVIISLILINLIPINVVVVFGVIGGVSCATLRF